MKIKIISSLLLTLPLTFACGQRDNPPLVIQNATPSSPQPAAPQQQQAESSLDKKSQTGDVGSERAQDILSGKNDDSKNAKPLQASENKQDQQDNKDGNSGDLLAPLPGVNQNQSNSQKDQKDVVAQSAEVPSTPAVDAAEKAATESPGPKKGIQPPGSRIAYTGEDQPRIQYYKLFVQGKQTPNDIVRLLFKDSDFNRSVEVMGDLYRQDKMAGNISPEVDVKFQELGQKVGNSVLIYNQRRRSAHYSKLLGSVMIGTLIGATAGGVFVKEEWIPEVISTRFGPRIPGYVKSGVVTGLATGATVLVTMEAYRIVNEFNNPKLIYNADPLLDVPSTQ